MEKRTLRHPLALALIGAIVLTGVILSGMVEWPDQSLPGLLADRQPTPAAQAGQAARPHDPASISDPPPQAPTDEPQFHRDTDGNVSRITDLNASGLSPLENIITPEGVIQIQRTFSLSGQLLQEKALLQGKEIPVPPKYQKLNPRPSPATTPR